MNNRYLLSLLAAGTLALASTAQAGFSVGEYCSTAGAHPDGLSTTNMTLNTLSATDCYGLVEPLGTGQGNVQNAETVAAVNALTWGNNLPLDTFSGTNSLKDDQDSNSVSASFLGLDWVLAAQNGSNSGNYTLTVTDNNVGVDPDLPFTTDVVTYLKAASGGGAFFLFEDIQINPGANGGTFTIAWVNGGDNNPALSGMTVFIGNPGGGPPTGVPVPGTLLLLGAPMVGLTFLRRRRK